MEGRARVEAGRAPIRIVIGDDHAIFRDGTRAVLEREEDLRVVGEAETGAEALELALELRPAVAILDIRMPGMNGLEVAARLAEAAPGIRTLILSAYDDDEYVTEALQRGAAGYLLKSAPGDELVSAVRSVVAGATVLHESISRQLLQRRQPPAAAWRLSSRELEILRLIAEGRHNKEIARRLGISLRTVETHLNNVFSKMGVSSRTEAVLGALNEQLISLR